MVAIINRCYDALESKVQAIHSHRQHIAFALAPIPDTTMLSRRAGVPVLRFDYGINPEFAAYANKSANELD